MNRTRFLKKLSSILLLGAALLMVSCQKDEAAPQPPVANENVTLVIHLQTSSHTDGGLRTQNIENDIENVRLLLFDNNDKLIAMPLVISPEDNNSWQVELPAGSSYKTAVAIANAGDLIGDNFLSNNKNKSRSAVLEKLVATETWMKEANGEPQRAIPMWGQLKDKLEISQNVGSAQLITFTMVRMLARIQVTMNEGVAYNLIDAHLLNYMDKGRIVPADSLLNKTLNIVSAPTIPSDAAKPEDPISTALKYEVPDGANSILNQIFTFEAPQGKSDTHLENTALVVGIQPKTQKKEGEDEGNGESQTVYYRVDFIQNNAYLSLLRNHSYNIKITGVSGNGHSSVAEAFKSVDSELKFEIQAWKDMDIDTELGGGNGIVNDGEGEGEGEGDDNGEGGDDNKGDNGGEIGGGDEGDTGEGNTGDEGNEGDNNEEITNAQAPSNCYIVKPGEAVVFPVSRANESLLGTQLTANDTYKARLVWQDKQSLISSIKVVDKGGDQRYIKVETSNTSGNAVVAVTDKDDTILWSWHIWVVDYQPEGEWMDRNLGALYNDWDKNDVSKQIDVLGCYYQPDRKDPFPGPSDDFKIQRGVYNITNGEARLTVSENNENKTMKNAIRNPFTFYPFNTPFGTNHSGSDKSIYDPCPEGYRIPSAQNPWRKVEATTAVAGGKDIHKTGGFYPFTGSLTKSTFDKINGFSPQGQYYFTHNSTPMRMIFTEDNVYLRTPQTAHHAFAYTIRCIKETP